MNNETLTCGIFYCRDSAEINGSGSLQTSSWFDSVVLRNRQQKHTADRYGGLKQISGQYRREEGHSTALSPEDTRRVYSYRPGAG